MLLSSDTSGLAQPERPLVSVVVPAFNAARYLGAALDSVLSQSLRDLEVIVVDDGSTDQTAVIAHQYAALDPRVRVHQRSSPSGKPAIARNDGIRMARGKMIALLDADDIATPTRFEDEVNAMLETGAGVAFADFHKFEGVVPSADEAHGFLQRSQFIARASMHLQPTDIRNVFLCRSAFVEYMLADAIAVNVQTVMFRSDVLEAHERCFDESYVGGEDIDLFYRLARVTPLVYVNAVHALMRIHPLSLTATHTEQCMVDAAEVRRINLNRLQSLLNHRQVDRARATVAENFLAVGYTQWRNGKHSAARAAFTTAWNLNPTAKALVSYARSFLPHWTQDFRLRSA